MNKQLAFAFLTWLLAGALQIPAHATEVWFQKYDTDNDGLWSYKEFVKANDDWVRLHPKEIKITTKELRNRFNDLDTDHRGYVRMEQVRTFHNWE